MKQALCMWAGLCLLAAPVARAQEEAAPGGDLTDPIEILKKVDAATKAVKAVRFHGQVECEGLYAKQIPNMEGTLLYQGPVDGRWPSKYRIDCKVAEHGSSEAREITVAYDGRDFYFLDPASKTIHQDTVITVIGRIGLAIADRLPMVEFIHATPFSDELEGDKVELQGTEKVGDQECYKIHVQYKNSQGEATWYFSKSDFLPRRVERLAKSRSGETGVLRQTVTDLEVDPEISADAYKVAVPEGFTQTTKAAH